MTTRQGCTPQQRALRFIEREYPPPATSAPFRAAGHRRGKYPTAPPGLYRGSQFAADSIHSVCAVVRCAVHCCVGLLPRAFSLRHALFVGAHGGAASGARCLGHNARRVHRLRAAATSNRATLSLARCPQSHIRRPRPQWGGARKSDSLMSKLYHACRARRPITARAHAWAWRLPHGRPVSIASRWANGCRATPALYC